ncbi:MAG: hypothetical protein ACF8PN_13535 [Phycisphaerales bacterium]
MNHHEPSRATSDALGHLRFGVSAACWVVGLALVVQILAWAFVNFTDVRQSNVAESTPTPPTVVSGDRVRTAARPRTESPATNDESSEASAASGDAEPIDPNIAVTKADVWLRVASQIAHGAGLAGLAWLVLLLFNGGSIAVAARAPGVARVVHATTWAAAILCLALPWQAWIPEIPYPGLFTSYANMVAESEAYLAGGETAAPAVLFYGRFLLLPGVATIATILIGLGYRAGVEGAVLSKGPSEFEIQIEEEASNRDAGSLVGGGRNASALRTTVAPSPSAEPSSASGLAHLPAAKPKPAARVEEPPAREPATVKEPATSAPLRRPI